MFSRYKDFYTFGHFKRLPNITWRKSKAATERGTSMIHLIPNGDEGVSK